MRRKILFISHKATRSGAPILLLNLIALLKEQTNLATEVVIKEDGELTDEFKKLVRTKVFSGRRNSVLQKIRRGIFKLLVKRSLSKFDVIISNTITNGNIDGLINKHSCIYTYVHELHSVIDSTTTRTEVAKVLAHSKMFLVPSDGVKENLIRSYAVNPKIIKRLPYYVPDYLEGKRGYREKLRKKYLIDDTAFIVGGMGAIEWRKGIDLFLQTARCTTLTEKSVVFIWCGGQQASSGWKEVLIEVEKLQLQKNFILIPENNCPQEVMAMFDIFFLSSREDPYPLVMIEAAMMNLPLVYFSNTGGADEFISGEGGFAAKQFEIDEVCKFIQVLKSKEGLRKSMAEKCRDKYVQMHTKEPVYKAFLEIIQPVTFDK